MAVIGVLVSLSVFGIQALQKSSRETSRLTDMKNIQGELESYYQKYGRYPDVGKISVNGSNFEIKDTTNSVFATIPILTLTPGFLDAAHAANVTYTNAKTDKCTELPSSDEWTIYYLATSSVAQKYALFACTEGGITSNLGTKND